MTTLKSALLGATMLIGAGAIAPANAADIYQGGGLKDEPAYMPAITWAGFYVGLHAGAALGSDRVTDVDALFPPAGRQFDVDDNGFIGGGQIGYNIQRGSLVLGVEGELGYLGLNKRIQDPASAADGDVEDTSFASVKSDLYGTLAGRIGFASDRWLIYAKGGAAVLNADFSYSNEFLDGGGGKTSDALTGWVAGGGVEYALSHNWSIKAEYLHFDFGDSTVHTRRFVGDTVFDQDFKNELTVDTVKAGINYRFGSNDEPLK